jgi:hypothetical protein
MYLSRQAITFNAQTNSDNITYYLISFHMILKISDLRFAAAAIPETS